MGAHTYILTDAASNTHLDELTLGPSPDFPSKGSIPWSVCVRTLRGGEQHGICVVDLCNGPLSLSILPTRGMSVWKGMYRELSLGWKSPVQRPVHPAYVNLHDRNGLGWLNGFNELMVRCGLAFNGPPGQDGGTPITLHGRIGNLPAHQVVLKIDDQDGGWLELRGVVDETSMFGSNLRLTSTVRMQLGSNRCEFTDDVTNLGGSPAPLSLLYHINIGRPFLEAGSRNVIAFREMAPRDHRAAEGVEQHAEYLGPTGGYAEQAYYYLPTADEQGWSTAVLHNAASTKAFAVHYQTTQLPRFVVWKNTVNEADGYVTGLEPTVNFPNSRSFEREHGRLPSIAPGGSYRATMAWELTDQAEGVEQLLGRVEQLRGGVSPLVHPLPQPGWSPAGNPTA